MDRFKSAEVLKDEESSQVRVPKTTRFCVCVKEIKFFIRIGAEQVELNKCRSIPGDTHRVFPHFANNCHRVSGKNCKKKIIFLSLNINY